MRFLYRRFGRRCVVRTSAVVAVVFERSSKRQRIGRRGAVCCCRETALADPLAEFLLRRTDLGQQLHGIENAVCLAQTTLDRSCKFSDVRGDVRTVWPADDSV